MTTEHNTGERDDEQEPGEVEITIGGRVYVATPPTFSRYVTIIADADENDWRTVIRAAFLLLDKSLQPEDIFRIKQTIDSDDEVLADVIAAFKKLTTEWAPLMNAKGAALGLDADVTPKPKASVNRAGRRATAAARRRA